jgi:hypothetical protein
MYCRITKIYCRKTVGHEFTKPVEIEGTTQTFFPTKLFFNVVHISAAGINHLLKLRVCASRNQVVAH